METDSTRVAVADGQRSFAEAIARVLAAERDLNVVGVAADQHGTRRLLSRGCEVLLLDASLDGDPLALTADVTRDGRTRVVLVAGHLTPDLAEDALAAGASALVPKGAPIDHLIDSVRAASRGLVTVPRRLLAEVLTRGRTRRPAPGAIRHQLSDRELEIVRHLADGMATKAIAEELVLSVNTVRTHVQNVLGKLDAHSRLEAVSKAIALGLIDPPGTQPVMAPSADERDINAA